MMTVFYDIFRAIHIDNRATVTSDYNMPLLKESTQEEARFTVNMSNSLS